MLEWYYQNPGWCIDYGHTVNKNPVGIDFHLHDRFEIYFFISGGVNYFIDRKVYPLKSGDLLIMNSSEIHKAHFKTSEVYERIVIHFEPDIARLLSSPDFDLLHCFNARPRGEKNKIELDKSQREEVLRLFRKLEGAAKCPDSGSAVLKLTCLIELLMLINRAFMNIKPAEEHPNILEKLVPVFDYIDGNLEGDLSLEALEQRFYINRFYLSRLFKKHTGINLHEYIIYKRISMAKKLLSEGISVTDACQVTGFNDYSNFIRIFKKATGIPPGQYRKRSMP